MHAQRKYWWILAGFGSARCWLSWQILEVGDMYATFFVIALLGAVLSYGLAALRARWLPCVQA
jgi:ABC-type nitrate/sulfonate/bicarbonate transport system permease component